MRYLTVLDHNGRKIPASRFMASAYEGASTTRRMSLWGTSSAGPNAELFGSLRTLRSRTRKLSMNNPLASGAVDSFVGNMIGRGITPRWQLEDTGLKKEIQDLWSDWVLDSDADGHCDFYGQQSLVARAMMEGGEGLGRFVSRRRDSGLSVPLQVQLLEGDHLPEDYSTLAENGNRIRMGIEIDTQGRRKAYHLYAEHPGETFPDADHTRKIRILAKDIMHVYRLLRIGQMRGRPWMTPIILRLYEIDQCDDAELVRRKTTAMFGGFITAPPGEDDEDNPVLGGDGGKDDEGQQILALEPGTFPKLPPGYEVTFSEPKDVSGNYMDWMKQNLHSIARGIGITYEQLTGDLKGVTYSSIRAGVIEFRRLCRQIQAQTIVFKFCQPTAVRFMDTAVLSGVLKIRDYWSNRRNYLRIRWRPDGWDWVDPVKDQKAEMMKVRNGFASRAGVVDEMCGDVEKIDRERHEDNQREKALGLVSDTNPAETTAAGVYQGLEDEEERDEGK